MAFNTSAPANSVSALVIVTGNTLQSPILMDRSYFIKTSNVIFKGGFEATPNNICIQANQGGG